jgi:hypothetical protein
MALKVTPMPPLLELRCLEYPFASILMSRGYILSSSVNVGEAKRSQASCCELVFIGDKVSKK